MNANYSEPGPGFALVIGLDRSDQKVDLCQLGEPQSAPRCSTVSTSPEALLTCFEELRASRPVGRIGLCLEAPAGNLLAFFATHAPWLEVYPVNPLTLKRFRETFVLSRANDDGKDALYLARLLQSHSDQLIQKAVALSEEPALVESFSLRVGLVVRQLAALLPVVAQYDRQIAETFDQHPDAFIFSSLPGAGPVLAPRLLAALGSQRERYSTATALQCSSAVAPVTRQSGGKRLVHRRRHGALFLRQSFHEWARESVRHSAWAKAYYEQQRTKGAPHHAAVRALAFKWQRVIWRCWRDRIPYCEKTYIAALQRARSPLALKLTPNPPPKINNNN